MCPAAGRQEHGPGCTALTRRRRRGSGRPCLSGRAVLGPHLSQIVTWPACHHQQLENKQLEKAAEGLALGRGTGDLDVSSGSKLCSFSHVVWKHPGRTGLREKGGAPCERAGPCPGGVRPSAGDGQVGGLRLR